MSVGRGDVRVPSGLIKEPARKRFNVSDDVDLIHVNLVERVAESPAVTGVEQVEYFQQMGLIFDTGILFMKTKAMDKTIRRITDVCDEMIVKMVRRQNPFWVVRNHVAKLQFLIQHDRGRERRISYNVFSRATSAP